MFHHEKIIHITVYPVKHKTRIGCPTIIICYRVRVEHRQTRFTVLFVDRTRRVESVFFCFFFFNLLPQNRNRSFIQQSVPPRNGAPGHTHSRSSSRSSCRSSARRRWAVVPRSNTCSARPAASCGPDGKARSCTRCPPAVPCRWTTGTGTRSRSRTPADTPTRWSPATDARATRVYYAPVRSRASCGGWKRTERKMRLGNRSENRLRDGFEHTKAQVEVQRKAVLTTNHPFLLPLSYTDNEK